ncbi:MAG: hypothetical protein A2015_00105 [Spirochaetes bacterium GWF1_31_7]|nr:MAG: hypothetical protein A2Y30_00280 [Spirochaetes bacterium GWE1_32_154]OHD50989.1 MAG: hypothetical protein A2Y29_10605 [Spirochaetes bacterium GWE2_31_10]OHD51643.1 MAG: hypothetical protein A2015_00105 [Spirochaetes bacterium GWF1_31_7]HBD94989.1 hypothetical protein [Spirochaetia bacterium]HBI36703.1 hypothetical protein [Spirochaetia bacterium]
MKKEYDFSKGVKGKFYIPENEIQLPIYLSKDNLDYFLNISSEKHIGVSDLVNTILKKKRELIESIR